MRIYCVTKADWEGMSVALVCASEVALVNLAKQATKEGYIDSLYCRVYDDVGIQVDEGYLYKTSAKGKPDFCIG